MLASVITVASGMASRAFAIGAFGVLELPSPRVERLSEFMINFPFSKFSARERSSRQRLATADHLPRR